MFFLSRILAFFPLIHNAQEIHDWFPTSQSVIEETAKASALKFEEELERFLTIPLEERTFDNTIRTWDALSGGIFQASSCLSAMREIHPDKSIRDLADSSSQKLQQIFRDALMAHPEIYQACLAAEKNSSVLLEEERYYFDDLVLNFKLGGMALPDEQRALFGKIQQEIAALESLFNRNIAENSSVLYVPKEALVGLEEEWIAAREKTEKGLYKLSCDLPTYYAVLGQCSVRDTRKAMHKLFNNRAFPENEEILKQLIAKRDQIAKLLGFSSFTACSISSQMAASSENAYAFLKQVKERASIKAKSEFQKVTKNLPESVLLSDAGQIEPFDAMFAFSSYEKERFSVDQNKIAEYFPLEKTVQGLIHVYEKFFKLSIKEVSHSIQIPDLKTLEIREETGGLLGVILLDLFPRAGKCSHRGLHCSLISSYSPLQGPNYRALSLIIGNFTKPTKNSPSKMTHSEVTTFFHEFGHAIHNVLGRSSFWSFCGTRVKRDFVELPSQLLEGWMLDASILKLVSSHYLTGAPLSDELIANLKKAETFQLGTWVQRQCFLSELSLALFEEGEKKDPTALAHQIWAREKPHEHCAPTNHMHASFPHLSGYGPRYYSYLWSKVFALDLFEKIDQEGLLNPIIGTHYARTILSKGGGKDPNQLLFDFLGRKPSVEPFFRQFDEIIK